VIVKSADKFKFKHSLTNHPKISITRKAHDSGLQHSRPPTCRKTSKHMAPGAGDRSWTHEAETVKLLRNQPVPCRSIHNFEQTVRLTVNSI
jgi:hypothetical protein